MLPDPLRITLLVLTVFAAATVIFWLYCMYRARWPGDPEDDNIYLRTINPLFTIPLTLYECFQRYIIRYPWLPSSHLKSIETEIHQICLGHLLVTGFKETEIAHASFGFYENKVGRDIRPHFALMIDPLHKSGKGIMSPGSRARIYELIGSPQVRLSPLWNRGSWKRDRVSTLIPIRPADFSQHDRLAAIGKYKSLCANTPDH
jgi:hypothetical protein